MCSISKLKLQEEKVCCDPRTRRRWHLESLFFITKILEFEGHDNKASMRKRYRGSNAPDGASGGIKGDLNWQEKQNYEKHFLIMEPGVFVVGADQAGLKVAAQL
ncbi:hypothetical protein PMIN03_010819 [Paraphaeosphaeria minitans]